MGASARARLIDDREQIAPIDDRLSDHLDHGRASFSVTPRFSPIKRPIAGKTGTTNMKDVWFVGFTPDLVAGVFMG